MRDTRPAGEALSVFLHDFLAHPRAHQGLARTLASLLDTRPETLAEGSQALEQAVAEPVAAAAEAGAIRDDVGAGAVMMALPGIGAAHGRPEWSDEAEGVLALIRDGLRQMP